MFDLSDESRAGFDPRLGKVGGEIATLRECGCEGFRCSGML